jgi:hypothetical protein
MSGQRHAPAALYPQGKDPGTHWTGGWVGLRAGLDTEAKGKILCPCRGSNPGTQFQFVCTGGLSDQIEAFKTK